MKRIICALLALAMVFSLAACGTPKKIVKDIKFRSSNFNTYLNVDVTFESINYNYSPYDGDKEQYKDGRWMVGTVNMTVNISPKSTNEMEFRNCKATLQIDTGTTQFSTKDLEITLDEKGCYTETIKLETSKIAMAADQNYSTIPTPVATHKVLEAEGNIEMHIKLDENGSVITASSEEQ